MIGTTILIIFAAYFGILYLISVLISRGSSDNDAFFVANRKSPWYIVAIGMIGTSVSGVTFVSVPGMVGAFNMSYMQMVFGFFFGYLVVAYLLLPLYYKLNLTSIYTYLDQRFGNYSYKTGASFFILSRIIGSAAKLYLVALILQTLVFDHWHIPFWMTVSGIILFIWIYTRKSGIKTIVWTDTLQTLSFIIAAILIIWQVSSLLKLDLGEAISTISNSPHSKIFHFEWKSPLNFFKQFFSGIFIVIVMTGLDQDNMQKNLTCKNLKDARKNMLTYGFLFTPINFLFLSLGILLLVFASQQGITLPTVSDEILPYLVSNYLGLPCLIFFTIGIIGASFANADSALASLTTSFCVDILGMNQNNDKEANTTRKRVHIGMSIVFILVILFIHHIGQDNILNTIYKVASYTYGPLLGLFGLGLFTKVQIKDKFAPIVCILTPIICYLIEETLAASFNYKVGYEILMLNGLLTVIGLLIISERKTTPKLT
ncbi:sodium:solute symporter [Dysgonomonas sp. HGC4]|uniref:sodium:solute symporter n=1 Tax=Dysgonomonas sp. HGC4 TaxID=1658009 RepID=UPI00067FDB17|nr:sodium:solute symporter [Dysgonomonas sp. HGC4]MBD8347186.1 sodium:solute symporter [Dysgonomonas sp. HGC4]